MTQDTEDTKSQKQDLYDFLLVLFRVSICFSGCEVGSCRNIDADG